MRKLVFNSCGKCENGYIYFKSNYEKVTQCACLINFNKKLFLLTKLKKANIPSSISTYNIKDYIGPDTENNIPKITQFIEFYKTTFYDKMIYFYGEKGTQKTTLAWYIGRELLKKNISVYYCLMNDLTNELTEDKFNEANLIDKYYDTDCLIIDRAFDSDQMTIYKSGYQLPFLDNFLRKRIEIEEKNTILISNSSVDNIASQKMNTDIEDFVRRKVLRYNTSVCFKDCYSLKDNFTEFNIFGETT